MYKESMKNPIFTCLSYLTKFSIFSSNNPLLEIENLSNI